MKAVDKFEYRRGYKFLPYASGGFAGDYTCHCRSGPDDSYSGAHDRNHQQADSYFAAVGAGAGARATSEEIARPMDIPVAKVRKVLKIAQEPISLETRSARKKIRTLATLSKIARRFRLPKRHQCEPEGIHVAGAAYFDSA